MMIKLLIVEDDPNFLSLVLGIVRDLDVRVTTLVAKSRDSALGLLQTESFDLVILDLTLPSQDGALDLNVDYGRYVFDMLSSYAPGTPVIILTASSAEPFIDTFISRSSRVDIWGDGEISTVGFLDKGDVDQLPDRLMKHFRSLGAVCDVELKTHDINLDWEQDRLVRIFVRRRRGVSCSLQNISGGLSGSSVYRVAVRDEYGVQILNSIVKIGSHKMVEAEAVAYRQHANRLTEAATARFIEDLRFGGGKSAAITYRLAEGFEENLVSVVQRDPLTAGEIVQKIAHLLKPWTAGAPEQRTTIGAIRRQILNDEKAKAAISNFELGWADAIEKKPVQAAICPSHCDMHCGNVLIGPDSTPIIIDYGDLKMASSCIDFITLELNVIFHKDGVARTELWPSELECKNWFDVTEFSKDSRFAPYLKACRSSCVEVSVGERQIAATAYAYILRQLCYDDTDKQKALWMLEGLHYAIEST